MMHRVKYELIFFESVTDTSFLFFKRKVKPSNFVKYLVWDVVPRRVEISVPLTIKFHKLQEVIFPKETPGGE